MMVSLVDYLNAHPHPQIEVMNNPIPIARATDLQICGAMLLAFASGCGRSAKQDAIVRETSHLKPLCIMYGQFGSRPPESEEQFKEFAAARAKTMFRALKFDSIDELFVSERDGQPYVIFYGKKPAGVPPDLVGYEQTGVNGRRLVGYALGSVVEVDEEEFRELIPDAP